MANNLIKNTIRDLQVQLADEFDRNFERKSFFNTPWKPTKVAISRGSLLLRTGALRQSIIASHSDLRYSEGSLNFQSSLPYAALHNDGGIIKVTAKMKKYFWAMYYKAAGSITKKQDGTASRSKRNTALTEEAQYWKNMALIKLGTELKVPQRQFIGHHPQVDKLVMEVIDTNVQDFLKDINQLLLR